MHCSKCGTALPDGAIFCSSCGSPTNSEQPAIEAASTKKGAPKTNKAKGCSIAGGIAVLLAVVISQCTSSNNDSGNSITAASQSQSQPPLEVTATELFNAYQNNEATAQGYFGKRPLLVSGTVDKVTLDFADDPVVGFVSPNQFMTIQAALADDAHDQAGNFNKNDKVKLLCQDVGEVVGTPMLKDCRTPPEGLQGVPVEWESDKKAK